MNKKKELTEEQKKEIAILKATNKMLNNSIRETEEMGKKESAELIKVAKEENISKMNMIDPAIAKEEMIKDKNNSMLTDESFNEDELIIDMNKEKTIYDNTINDNDLNDEVNDTDELENVNNDTMHSSTENITDTNEILDDDKYNDKSNLQYDVIPLPSKGECYKNKMNRLKVAYLTAWSENLITSPHLYQDDLIIDALLKYQILNKNINTDDLIQGDVDAIMLWLRSTGYGDEYPVHVKDPQTNEEFDSVVDLSKLKIKEFKLKADKNGWFEYVLPITKAKVKFKYLSRREERLLTNINNMEVDNIKADIVKKSYNQLKNAIKYENKLNKDEKRIINTALDNMKIWIDKKPKETKINHVITNRLEFCIQSINDNEDKAFISNFIKNMPSLDSLKLRRYINDNEPGVDWNVTVEKPESLGGGSFNLFLEWESNAFLNIA